MLVSQLSLFWASVVGSCGGYGCALCMFAKRRGSYVYVYFGNKSGAGASLVRSFLAVSFLEFHV